MPRLEVERRGYDIYNFGERVSIEIMLFLSDKFFLILFFLIFICPLDHCAADSHKIYNLCSSRPQMHHNRIEKNCPTSLSYSKHDLVLMRDTRQRTTTDLDEFKSQKVI